MAEVCVRCARSISGKLQQPSGLDPRDAVCALCYVQEQAWTFLVPHVSLPPNGQECAFWDPTLIDAQKV